MNKRHLSAALAASITLTGAHAEEKTPGYNQKIPEKIMTPDKGWFMIFRLYSPLEPWYDKTWRLGEPKLAE